MARENQIYVDGALPFGLRSAPKIFNAVAEALLFGWKANGAEFAWHYLDDFITIRRSGSGECSFNCELLHHLCKKLGIPLAEESTKAQQLPLPSWESRLTLWRWCCVCQEKLHCIQEELEHWQAKKRCTKHELQSVRLIATRGHSGSAGHIYLCSTFVICWPQLKLTGTTYTLTLSPTPTWHDGLHFWPVGMVCLSNGAHNSFNIQWFQMSWVSVVVEPTAIGNGFSSVVWLQRTGRINNGERADTNRNSGCSVGQTLDRPYSPVQMRQRIGSRNRLSDFLQKAPGMQPGLCRIPQEVWELLFSPLNWTSPSCRLQFSTILRMA